MFFLVGLGLGHVKDITVRGLEIVRAAKVVFLESYTSVLPIDIPQLEEFYGRPVLKIDRHQANYNINLILEEAKFKDIVLLAFGNPCASTHADLLLCAQDLDIETEIIHNSSIINGIGCTGLQLINFGEVVSIPYWTENWKPLTFVEKINQNLALGFHTLCLLDIPITQPTFGSLVEQEEVHKPTTVMEIRDACYQILQAIDNKLTPGNKCLSIDTLCVGAARIGWPDQKIVAGPLIDMVDVDMGPPLHSLVIIGNVSPQESSYLIQFSINKMIENASVNY